MVSTPQKKNGQDRKYRETTLCHSCCLGPFLASHLNESRAGAGKGEDLLFSSEHRRAADDFIGEALQKDYQVLSNASGETELTRSSITLRM